MSEKAITKLLAAIIAVVILVAVIGVGLFYYFGNLSTPTVPASEFKMAMIIPNPINDYSWNAGGYNALMDIKRELGITVAYSENLPALPDAERAARQYATDGFNLVYLHGAQFRDVTWSVAKDFPNTWFACPAQATNETPPGNVVEWWYSGNEEFYTLGALAGLMTKTNKISVIGGLQIPMHVAYVNAIILGAKSVNPNVQVNYLFLGTFTDTALAKQTALAQIEAGSDMIFPFQNQGVLGVIDAIRETGNKTKIFGFYNDMSALAPDLYLSSFVCGFTKPLTQIAQGAMTGQLGGTVINKTPFKDGVNYIAPYHGLVPNDVETRIDEIQQDIKSGTIQVPWIFTSP